MFKLCLLRGLFLLSVFSLCVSPGYAVPITNFGAVPNDNVDDTAAIRAAIAQARAGDGKVEVPAGRFIASGFVIEGASLTGQGDSSIIHAPDPNNAIIFLRGNGVSISRLKLTTPDVERIAGRDRLFVDRAVNFTIQEVTIDGSNATGIFDDGGSFGKILNNRVSNTNADSIHNTNGAHDLTIAGNVITNSGDDGIALIAYSDNAANITNVLIEGNTLLDQPHGRGITVAGGTKVTLRNNVIQRANFGAGILVTCETGWPTHPVDNILVEGNNLVDVTQAIPHGAIMVYSDCSLVSKVLLRNNVIRNARHDAIRLFGNVRDIFFDGTAVYTPRYQAFNISGGTNIGCRGSTLDGSPITPANCGGSLSYTVSGTTIRLADPAPASPSNLRQQ